MKLVTFESGDRDRVGALRGNFVVDIGLAIDWLRSGTLGFEDRPELQNAVNLVLTGGASPRHMIDFLERGETWRRALGKILETVSASREPSRLPQGIFAPLEKVRLRAPILRPGKIVCVGLNYESHRAEQGIKSPAVPVFFLKSGNTICGPGDPIVLPPNSREVDYEAEFVAVIGKPGKGIPEEKVFEHIAGYTVLNDVSARDMQYGDRQWFRGKSCDTFGPTGPCIVSADRDSRPALPANLTHAQRADDARFEYARPDLQDPISGKLSLPITDLGSRRPSFDGHAGGCGPSP